MPRYRVIETNARNGVAKDRLEIMISSDYWQGEDKPAVGLQAAEPDGSLDEHGGRQFWMRQKDVYVLIEALFDALHAKERQSEEWIAAEAARKANAGV